MTSQDVLDILQEYLDTLEGTSTAGYARKIDACPISKALRWKTEEKWYTGTTAVYIKDCNMDPVSLQSELVQFIKLIDSIPVVLNTAKITAIGAREILKFILDASKTKQELERLDALSKEYARRIEEINQKLGAE